MTAEKECEGRKENLSEGGRGNVGAQGRRYGLKTKAEGKNRERDKSLREGGR